MPRLLRTDSTPKMSVAHADANCVMPLNLTVVVGTHMKVGTEFGRNLLTRLTRRRVLGDEWFLRVVGGWRERLAKAGVLGHLYHNDTFNFNLVN